MILNEKQRRYKIPAFICLIILMTQIVYPQMVSAQQSQGTGEPEPYGEDEFPEWLTGIRRAEIVAVGAFPFAFLVSRLSYGLYRLAANDFQSEYVPELFNTGSAVPLEREEKVGIIIASVGISLTVALSDFIVLKIRERRAERESGAEQGERQ